MLHPLSKQWSPEEYVSETRHSTFTTPFIRQIYFQTKSSLLLPLISSSLPSEYMCKYTWAIINGHGLTFALLLYIYNHN